jgi:hypothetical protein
MRGLPLPCFGGQEHFSSSVRRGGHNHDAF